MNGDTVFSPWPLPGKWYEWRRRQAVCVKATPQYGLYLPEALETIEVKEVNAWFLTVRNRLFHFYIGYRPITLADSKFYWRNHPDVKPHWEAGKLFVERKKRWGIGAIS